MRSWILGAVLALAQGEAAAQVVRWIDERGMVNYGTAVPPQYKSSARPVAIDKPPGESRQQEAEARARKDREAAAAASKPAKTGDESGETPAPLRQENLGCVEQWREYEASWACFESYRIQGGGIRGEAFEHCQEVRMPDCIRPAGDI